MRAGIALLALTLLAGDARADALVDKLVEYAYTGCDYLAQMYKQRPRTNERILAAHFGRIKKTTRNGSVMTHHLDIAPFAGWKASYSQRFVTLTLPDDVVLRVADLARRLGQPQYVDDDRAVRETSAATDDAPAENDLEFRDQLKMKGCIVEVHTDNSSPDLLRQRVLGFTFGG